MKSIQKDQFLDSLEARVERHIQQGVADFQNLSEEVLLAPAQNGGWSVAQCLEHLNSYGHYYLPEIQKALASSQTKPDSQLVESTWLGNYFTQMMDPTTGKKKYKAFKNHIPAPTLNAYQVVAEFIQQQEALLSYLKQARHTNLNSVRVPISISKWIRLKLGDVLQFLIAHTERHVAQAQKNLI